MKISHFQAFLIHFVISEPPAFVEEPNSVDVVKGSTVMFGGKVAGSPPFTVTWFKDNKILKSSHKYIFSDDMSLKVQDCNIQDVGSYQCVVANEVGSCTCSADLSLRGWFDY